MRLGILFSGGKDSTYAALLAKKLGYEIGCLISIRSKNPDSYMFHTPSINAVEKQAWVMGLPLILVDTKGEKEEELKDLKKAIKSAIKKYEIEGVVTGAVESVYQASRIQKICHELKIECFNPLWQKDQTELLKELIREKFEIVISGVAAEGLNGDWVGREIDNKFLKDIGKMSEKYGISVSGEGGEFESLVLNCPLFKKGLKIKSKKIVGEGNSFRLEAELV